MIVKIKLACIRFPKVVYPLLFVTLFLYLGARLTHFNEQEEIQVIRLKYTSESRVSLLQQDNSLVAERAESLDPTNVNLQTVQSTHGHSTLGSLPVRSSTTRDCSPPKDVLFPFCRKKFKEFKQHWNEECHGKKFKVNTSDPCSVLVYLSEIEPWCPPLPWRQANTSQRDTKWTEAKIRTNITGLLELLQGDNYAWIRMRAQSSWAEWVEGVEGLERKENLQGRKKQRIVVFTASLATNHFMFETAFKGGPLGELVQWTDVICTLYALGHDLIITSDVQQIKEGKILSKHQNGCALKDVFHVDRILTDITGAVITELHLGPTYAKYKCKLLLLDSFGTEAEFNYAFYEGPSRGSGSPWGNRDVHLRQLMTMYPHSPDNLFMGFAIPRKSKKINSNFLPERKIQGFIYGKAHEYFMGKRKYLDILHKYLELHGTISGAERDIRTTVPDYVINHGIVNGSELVRLLQESKVFIGLGFPFEGPAPLDAVANGCFYVNPKVFPAKSRKNSEFFRDKPTNRKITSQNPYAEDFIGSPYVYTIDMNNDTVVENTIKEILASKELPHLSYEFTHEGMLQRVNIFLENTDFCTSGHQWPSKTEMRTLIGREGQSCKELCFKTGLICEPGFFHFLNNIKQFKRAGFDCKTYREEESIYAPSLNSTDGSCLLQDLSLLYSCVASHPHITRICPCRTYQKEQVALYQT